MHNIFLSVCVCFPFGLFFLSFYFSVKFIEQWKIQLNKWLWPYSFKWYRFYGTTFNHVNFNGCFFLLWTIDRFEHGRKTDIQWHETRFPFSFYFHLLNEHNLSIHSSHYFFQSDLLVKLVISILQSKIYCWSIIYSLNWLEMRN